ncbi:hypothetical protein [Acinetobacter colistiniresistens]|uniref:hypothetical protein n=1 Tax=Acinetobacter colistiniresistens TaxID=280145 RepID=UPI0012D71DD6|nr:hypothetical protein [Acinetobacter colistiniresistens]
MQQSHLILKNLGLKGAPLHLRKIKDFDVCLNELIELKYIRLKIINNTTYLELNPALLK